MEADRRAELTAIVGEANAAFAPDLHPDDLRDESLHPTGAMPWAVAHPASTAEVAAVARLAAREGLSVTARGSGTGLSGAAAPLEGGLVVAFDRMDAVLRVDVDDHVAVVQPGVTLRALDEALAGTGLHYPVYPGELSGSIGGNVNTNAGGMRAVRHGVTRHHVVGLELVLADGTVVRTGGPVVKSSTGYDLTQLVIGSEGTLALVTEVTLRLSPRLEHATTVLVPYDDVERITAVVPRLVASGLEPSILEYIDALVMAAITAAAGLTLGVEASVAASASAYLVVVLETRTADQLDADLAALAGLLETSGALDVYVLGARTGAALVEARERAFWTAKAAGVNDVVDVVVPRSRVADFLAETAKRAAERGALVSGCGHVGDGNVHVSVFLGDDVERAALLRDLCSYAVSLGGQVSGEHGVGVDKRADVLALADPAWLELQARVKAAFDPAGRLNPGRGAVPG
ncbi:MAG TPA: FAD-linked oxidase C-terminal domain-containing protein [Acidimicrobiales bacterium]|nr:FAD-linked oxidase C-terminal domain-containing protein [Acidimicrobiales bacterium]